MRDRQWDRYGEWLLERVGFDRPNYDILMTELHNNPFEFFVDHDDNRAEDGISLRDEFGADLGFRHIEFDKPCSVLEMLVALAIRIEDEYIGDPEDEHPEIIFWEMVCNLGLDRCSDKRFNKGYVNSVLKKWIRRDFNKSGHGSIFPLRKPTRDQTRIEIWSQMNEYLSENYPL